MLAEDLARRELDEPLDAVARRDRRLEGVVRADHVHPHREDRVRDDRVDARDPGGVDDVRAAGHELGEPREVEHVPLDEPEVRVRLEVRPREGVAMEVVDGDHLVRVDEASRERRADEAGAARDEDALARQ